MGGHLLPLPLCEVRVTGGGLLLLLLFDAFNPLLSAQCHAIGKRQTKAAKLKTQNNKNINNITLRFQVKVLQLPMVNVKCQMSNVKCQMVNGKWQMANQISQFT